MVEEISFVENESSNMEDVTDIVIEGCGGGGVGRTSYCDIEGYERLRELRTLMTQTSDANC